MDFVVLLCLPSYPSYPVYTTRTYSTCPTSPTYPPYPPYPPTYRPTYSTAQGGKLFPIIIIFIKFLFQLVGKITSQNTPLQNYFQNSPKWLYFKPISQNYSKRFPKN